ncbi:MAG: NYN domain-containing protein [bacterium]|nr:NYN domain-containing protein [bacterium]
MMTYDPQTQNSTELIDRIIEQSTQTLELLTSDDHDQLKELLIAATNTVLNWRQKPLEFHRETVISEVTGLAYRLSNALYEESQWDACERLSFLSYQLAAAVDWRERALGALKLALLAGTSQQRLDDLDRLRSRVRQRIRRLLGVQASFDRLPSGIDLNRLADDIVWKIWDRLWLAQSDDDCRRTLLRKNLRFGWNYTFSHAGHPARTMFREQARSFLSGDIAGRIATGEIEAEWRDLFDEEMSAKISEWSITVDNDTVIAQIGGVAESLENRLTRGLERWLEWWRPLKTLREGDREAIDLFREAQQSLFEEDALPRAVDTFRAAFDLAPSDLGVKEWFAYSLILTQDYVSAERLLQQIIAARRQDFATIVNLAGIYVRTGRMQDAAELLCPVELFDRNLHRRPYVAAVMGLLLSLKRTEDLPARIVRLETAEWLPLGLFYAIQHNTDPMIKDRLLHRIIDEAGLTVGKKGSDLSDPNDALVPIARLEKDFAYFQTEGLLEEGIAHFRARTERYPWFWANWHYLGKLSEMTGNIEEAKYSFMRKAEATASSKAPQKSKQENWHYYLEFCFRNELYDDLRVGIQGAAEAGMADAKLARYRRALQSTEPTSYQAPLEYKPSIYDDSDTEEGEEYVAPNANAGLIGFTFAEPYPENTDWRVYANPEWHGSVSVLPVSKQDPARHEVAVHWSTKDGTQPSSVTLHSENSGIEAVVKLYRTDRSPAPLEHQGPVRLLELYHEIQNRIRRHLVTTLPGEVLAIEAPAGFGVNTLTSEIAGLSNSVQCPIHLVRAPEGTLSSEKIVKWLREVSSKCFTNIPLPVDQSPAGFSRWIEQLRAAPGTHTKQAVVLQGFAEHWNIATHEQVMLLTSFLDLLLKLTDMPELVWIVGSNDLFYLRRQLPHPFWRSLQVLRLPAMNEDLAKRYQQIWFDERKALSETASTLLYQQSGGLAEIYALLLREAARDANGLQQQRILAANVLSVANWTASGATYFSDWARLQLPSNKVARIVLDRLYHGEAFNDHDPDIMYLREIGIVTIRDNVVQISTPLYRPQLAGDEVASDPTEPKSHAVLLVDHENLFLGLKDTAVKNSRPWNDRDGSRIAGIAHKLIEWVKKEHKIISYPLAIANWDNDPFLYHMRPYQGSGFYTMIPEGSKENSADFMIYLECSRLLREHTEVDTVVLVTGDGDFTMLVRSLKSQGKRVRVLAVNGSTSLALRSAVGSDFQFIEPLIES